MPLSPENLSLHIQTTLVDLLLSQQDSAEKLPILLPDISEILIETEELSRDYFYKLAIHLFYNVLEINDNSVNRHLTLEKLEEKAAFCITLLKKIRLMLDAEKTNPGLWQEIISKEFSKKIINYLIFINSYGVAAFDLAIFMDLQDELNFFKISLFHLAEGIISREAFGQIILAIVSIRHPILYPRYSMEEKRLDSNIFRIISTSEYMLFEETAGNFDISRSFLEDSFAKGLEEEVIAVMQQRLQRWSKGSVRYKENGDILTLLLFVKGLPKDIPASENPNIRAVHESDFHKALFAILDSNQVKTIYGSTSISFQRIIPRLLEAYGRILDEMKPGFLEENFSNLRINIISKLKSQTHFITHEFHRLFWQEGGENSALVLKKCIMRMAGILQMDPTYLSQMLAIFDIKNVRFSNMGFMHDNSTTIPVFKKNKLLINPIESCIAVMLNHFEKNVREASINLPKPPDKGLIKKRYDKADSANKNLYDFFNAIFAIISLSTEARARTISTNKNNKGKSPKPVVGNQVESLKNPLIVSELAQVSKLLLQMNQELREVKQHLISEDRDAAGIVVPMGRQSLYYLILITILHDNQWKSADLLIPWVESMITEQTTYIEKQLLSYLAFLLKQFAPHDDSHIEKEFEALISNIFVHSNTFFKTPIFDLSDKDYQDKIQALEKLTFDAPIPNFIIQMIQIVNAVSWWVATTELTHFNPRQMVICIQKFTEKNYFPECFRGKFLVGNIEEAGLPDYILSLIIHFQNYLEIFKINYDLKVDYDFFDNLCNIFNGSLFVMKKVLMHQFNLFKDSATIADVNMNVIVHKGRDILKNYNQYRKNYEDRLWVTPDEKVYIKQAVNTFLYAKNNDLAIKLLAEEIDIFLEILLLEDMCSEGIQILSLFVEKTNKKPYNVFLSALRFMYGTFMLDADKGFCFIQHAWVSQTNLPNFYDLTPAFFKDHAPFLQQHYKRSLITLVQSSFEDKKSLNNIKKIPPNHRYRLQENILQLAVAFGFNKDELVNIKTSLGYDEALAVKMLDQGCAGVEPTPEKDKKAKKTKKAKKANANKDKKIEINISVSPGNPTSQIVTEDSSQRPTKPCESPTSPGSMKPKVKSHENEAQLRQLIPVSWLPSSILELSDSLMEWTSQPVALGGSTVAKLYLGLNMNNVKNQGMQSDFDIRVFNCALEEIFPKIKALPNVKDCEITGKYPVLRFTLEVDGKNHEIEIASVQNEENLSITHVMKKKVISNTDFSFSNLYILMALTNGKRREPDSMLKITGPKPSFHALNNERISLVDKGCGLMVIAEDPSTLSPVILKTLFENRHGYAFFKNKLYYITPDFEAKELPISNTKALASLFEGSIKNVVIDANKNHLETIFKVSAHIPPLFNTKLDEDPVCALRLIKYMLTFKQFKLDNTLKTRIENSYWREIFSVYIHSNSTSSQPAGRISGTLNSLFSRFDQLETIELMGELGIFEGLTHLAFTEEVKGSLALLLPFANSDGYTKRKILSYLTTIHYCLQHPEMYGEQGAFDTWEAFPVMNCLARDDKAVLSELGWRLLGVHKSSYIKDKQMVSLITTWIPQIKAMYLPSKASSLNGSSSPYEIKTPRELEQNKPLVKLSDTKGILFEKLPHRSRAPEIVATNCKVLNTSA